MVLRIKTWLEELSKKKLNYYFSFIFDTCTALVLLGGGLWLSSAEGWTLLLQATALFAGGFVFFGFVEYLFHRWIFHSRLSPAKSGHAAHHQDPLAILALPWFFDPIVFAIGWGLFYLLLHDTAQASIAASGQIIRYVAYGLLHHSFHHADFRWQPWRRLRAYHNIHHELEDRNFGVSSPAWDYLLGTHYRARRYIKATSAVRQAT
ncbi:MAG: sterol desaturase family protein [Spirochaetales bacterium]|nr:sterol desaturase family protein [Spirochaetales bacterium]